MDAMRSDTALVARHASGLNVRMINVPPASAPASPASPDARPEDLLRAVARERDGTAFRALFVHYAPRVKSYIMRLGCPAATAEELMQEVMVTVWRRAETFDPAQASAATWIFTIARNRRIDLVRRERRPELDPDDPALVPASAIPADRTVEAAQDEARLKAAMEALPEPQRDLLTLAYYEDRAHSEIAAMRNLPLGTVKSRIRLALEKLRHTLADRRHV